MRAATGDNRAMSTPALFSSVFESYPWMRQTFAGNALALHRPALARATSAAA